MLFENRTKEKDLYFGRDEFFNSVIVKSNYDLTGKVKNVKISSCNQNTLFGELISNKNQKFYAA